MSYLASLAAVPLPTELSGQPGIIDLNEHRERLLKETGEEE